MLIETGIMISTYFGIRVFEKVKAKIHSTETNKQLQLSTNKSTDKELTKQEKEQTNEKIHIQIDRRLSFLSIGLSAVRQFVYPPLAPLSLGLYIYTMIPYIRRVEKSLLEDRKVNIDVLFFTADAIVLTLGQYFTAAVGVWMIHEGAYAVAKAQGRSEKMLVDIFAQQPSNVWILRNNVEIEIPLEQVNTNDILVVNTGEVIPCDGIITEGFATIDQHALTGESQPVEKASGDKVLASTFIMTGRIYMRVEKSGEDTTIAKVGEILQNSAHFKSNVQLKGEEWANRATLPMLLLATGIVLPIFGPASTVVFISTHFGVRVRIFAPLTTLNHIALAAHKGILVKDGRALESLNNIDTVVFDKTGTLTNEQPVVGAVILSDGYSEEEILMYAAAAERKFTHPIAKAITQKAEAEQLILPNIEDSNYQIGYGVTVNHKNQTIKVGSLRFMTMEGLSIPDSIKEIESDIYNKGSSLIFVAIDDKVSGAIEIQPQVRPEVESIIADLRQRGIKHIAIISGDHQEPTRNLAEKLGMDDYHYDILPENKATIVEQLQKEGRSVCFIGDGINDAIAMKKANVSISLAGATSIATDMAEVVLMDGSLSHLSDLFDISKKLDTSLDNALLYSIVPSVINLGGAFMFHFSILTAFLINGTSGLVTLYSVMQPLREISNDKKAELKKELLEIE